MSNVLFTRKRFIIFFFTFDMSVVYCSGEFCLGEEPQTNKSCYFLLRNCLKRETKKVPKTEAKRFPANCRKFQSQSFVFMNCLCLFNWNWKRKPFLFSECPSNMESVIMQSSFANVSLVDDSIVIPPAYFLRLGAQWFKVSHKPYFEGFLHVRNVNTFTHAKYFSRHINSKSHLIVNVART